MGTSVSEAAIEYAQRGWRVTPTSVQEKRPYMKGWTELATTDLSQVGEWWKPGDSSGVAIVTGAESGIVVLDIDLKSGGYKSLEALERKYGPLPKTLTVLTGGGGKHFYFRHPGFEFKNKAGIVPGVDIRGDGGCAIAPPTKHPSGGTYRWENSEPLADIPGWLISLVRPHEISATKGLNKGGMTQEGGRNDSLAKFAGTIRKAGGSYEVMLAALVEHNQQTCNPPLPESEVERIARSMTRYPRGAAVGGASSPLAADIADDYLAAEGLQSPLETRLRCWGSDFYRYMGTRYLEWKRDEVESSVIGYLRNRVDTRPRATKKMASDVLANVAALTRVPSETLMPAWLGSGARSARSCIPLENGILDVGKLVDGGINVLSPHTPDFFSLACLPYPYSPDVSCPKWLAFLEEMVPEQGVRDLLQEWFGYNLVFDNSHQKFLVLYGEGANGKSVICQVLRLMLGDFNVSAVGLESFDPKRTFPLAGTFGKLANIVGEIGDIDKAAEGLLKQFTAGDVMTIERKHRDPFEVIPTARLTFATNVLPRFNDKSDGVWRRMIPIPLTKQILDQGKQDKRLVDPEWWKASGELPGVLNWAVEGLIRLRARERFVLPESCERALEAYKLENNPARVFLMDNYEVRPGAQLRSTSLYSSYQSWMQDRGNKPMAIAFFSKEVPRVFPGAHLSANPVRLEGERCRVWIGIGPIADAPGTGGTALSHLIGYREEKNKEWEKK